MAGSGFLKRVVLGSAAAAAAAVWAMGPRSAQNRKAHGVHALPDVMYAHRGLHDAGSGLVPAYAAQSGEYVALARRMALRAGYGTADHVGPIAPENSMAAFAAACEAGYGIELDIQLTADGKVVVLHDADLLRVAGDPRRLEDLTYDELCGIALFPVPAKPGDSVAQPLSTGESAETDVHVDASGDGDQGQASQGYFQHAPLLDDVLTLVEGRVPIIVEYKFSGYEWGTRQVELMEKGAALLDDYEGAYAVESFHPMAMGWYAKHRPEVYRGQLAADAAFDQSDIKDWAAGKLLGNWMSRPDFVAYDWHGGDAAQVRLVKAMGVTAVSWTLRSQEEFDRSAKRFSRHIFEAFVPRL